MFDILSDEELSGLPTMTATLPQPHIVAEAQKKHTLGQVYDWGEKGCPHNTEPDPYSNGRISTCRKRECEYCWKELEKETK